MITAFMGNQSEMASELSKLEALVPGATAMVAHVVAAVAAHPLVAAQLIGSGSDEAAIAASRGSDTWRRSSSPPSCCGGCGPPSRP